MTLFKFEQNLECKVIGEIPLGSPCIALAQLIDIMRQATSLQLPTHPSLVKCSSQVALAEVDCDWLQYNCAEEVYNVSLSRNVVVTIQHS